MPKKTRTSDGSTQSDGYVKVIWVCENAPANSYRGRDGHTYESYGVGNGAGWRWLDGMRSHTCSKCGGKLVRAKNWQPKESEA